MRFSKKRRLKERKDRLLKCHLHPLTITIQREDSVILAFLFCCSFYYLLGTRKHPKKQTVMRKKTSEGLTNPLQLVTSKAMFSASSFAELNISEKLVFAYSCLLYRWKCLKVAMFSISLILQLFNHALSPPFAKEVTC